MRGRGCGHCYWCTQGDEKDCADFEPARFESTEDRLRTRLAESQETFTKLNTQLGELARENDALYTHLAEVEKERDALLRDEHLGSERGNRLARECSELQRDRDEWKAKAEKLEATLMAKHGGEPLALLEELDEWKAHAETSDELLDAALKDYAEWKARAERAERWHHSPLPVDEQAIVDAEMNTALAMIRKEVALAGWAPPDTVNRALKALEMAYSILVMLSGNSARECAIECEKAAVALREGDPK